MRIAFYAPLKDPDHPVPSGDREMARLLMRALAMGGHEVAVVSTLRSFRPSPALEELETLAAAERDRIAAAWRADGPPDLWFSYHPYYKAPDLLGPALTAHFAIPYVTAECSYAPKRDHGPWASSQALVAAAARQARLNLCFTGRDQTGLDRLDPQPKTARVDPFIDTAPYENVRSDSEPGRLLAIAMMRPGDKLRSYTFLAAALGRLSDIPWSLTVVGDGPCRPEVEELLGRYSPHLPGQVSPLFLRNFHARASLYAWPGCGEAYGLAYLEAQAAGLPVVAQATAGVPAVVIAGETGILTPEGDVEAYASAIRQLLQKDDERRAMGTRARRFVLEERSLTNAAKRINSLLEAAL